MLQDSLSLETLAGIDGTGTYSISIAGLSCLAADNGIHQSVGAASCAATGNTSAINQFINLTRGQAAAAASQLLRPGVFQMSLSKMRDGLAPSHRPIRALRHRPFQNPDPFSIALLLLRQLLLFSASTITHAIYSYHHSRPHSSGVRNRCCKCRLHVDCLADDMRPGTHTCRNGDLVCSSGHHAVELVLRRHRSLILPCLHVQDPSQTRVLHRI